MLKTSLAALAALLTLAGIASAQTTTFTFPLTNPNASYVIDDGSGVYANATKCGGAGNPVCPWLVQYIQGPTYGPLTSSDGTGPYDPYNGGACYTWAVWQLGLGTCQTMYRGGGSLEGSALYCGPETASDVGGVFNMTCVAGFEGTAVTVINGVDTPIQTQFNLVLQIFHHPVKIWVQPFRGARHTIVWQQIDGGSMISMTPIVP